MKVFSLTVFLAIVFMLTRPFNGYGQFVRVSNGHVVDGESQKIKLHSVSLGGWLLWEGWIWGGGFTKESVLHERLKQILISLDDYKTFVKQYYDTFITEQDIAKIAGAGFNSIRVPFNYRVFGTYDKGIIDGFAMIDQLIGWCKILDMHAAPGGQNSLFISDPEDVKLFESTVQQQKAVQLWVSIAQKYTDEPIIAGYDLLNEPSVSNNKTLIDYYQRLVRQIRMVDKNHILFIEGNKLAKDFKGFPAKFDDNEIYSYHYYPWFSEKSKEKNLQRILSTIPVNAVTWCGEWGEDKQDNLIEIKELLNGQQNSCGESFWTWKRVYKNNNRYPACSITTSADWDRISRYLTYGVFKPTPKTSC
jgi:endoglucanase